MQCSNKDISPTVPAHPVETDYPTDVIEGQQTTFNCGSTVSNTGSVFLTYFNEMTGDYNEFLTEKVSTAYSHIEQCKSSHWVTYNMTLDMTFNSTSFRCQSASPRNVSASHRVLVIPGIIKRVSSFYFIGQGQLKNHKY